MVMESKRRHNVIVQRGSRPSSPHRVLSGLLYFSRALPPTEPAPCPLDKPPLPRNTSSKPRQLTILLTDLKSPFHIPHHDSTKLSNPLQSGPTTPRRINGRPVNNHVAPIIIHLLDDHAGQPAAAVQPHRRDGRHGRGRDSAGARDRRRAQAAADRDVPFLPRGGAQGRDG